MPKLRVFTPKKALKILLKKDFYVHHQTGSHVNLRHYFKVNLHVVIPMHNRDLNPKTLKSIIQQCDLNSEEIKEFY